MSSYFGVIYKSIEGGFVAHFPDFSEAFTQGADLEECVIMAYDALQITIEAYQKENRDFPVPSTLEETKQYAQKEFIEENEFLDTTFEPFVQLFIPDRFSTEDFIPTDYDEESLEDIFS